MTDKEKIRTEVERRIKSLESNIGYGIGVDFQINAYESLLSFINTLEVKEVDLDSDIRTYLTNHFNIYEDGVLQSKKSGLPLSTYDIIKVAKHFFELGIKESHHLTWKDINLIDHLLFDIKEDYDNGKLDKEEYYKEVLKKFKEQL